MTRKEFEKWEETAKNFGAGVAEGCAIFVDGNKIYGVVRCNEALGYKTNAGKLAKCAEEAKKRGFVFVKEMETARAAE